MLIRILLVSGGLSIFAPITITHAADTVVRLDKTDKNFLKHPIDYDITFPPTSQSSLKNEAAKFINNTLRKNPKDYQALFNALITKDKQLSNRQHNAILPGSFLNTAADLYANIDIDSPLFGNTVNPDETTINITRKQELLKFAALLLKEAKIINRSSSNLKDRVKALEKTLAETKAQGKLPPKIYVYSDSLTEKPYYIEVIRRYYPHHHKTLVYQVVPSIYDPAYIKTLTGAAAGFGTALIFFSRLPETYPPFWSPIWHPFFHAFRGKIYADQGGRHYNISKYIHQNFTSPHAKKTVVPPHTEYRPRKKAETNTAHSRGVITHSGKMRAAPQRMDRDRPKVHPPQAHPKEFRHRQDYHGTLPHRKSHFSHRKDEARHRR